VNLMPMARLSWGGLLTVVPSRVLRTLTGRPATGAQVAVLRVLGTLHLLQGGYCRSKGKDKELKEDDRKDKKKWK